MVQAWWIIMCLPTTFVPSIDGTGRMIAL